jgi:phosphomannomutase
MTPPDVAQTARRWLDAEPDDDIRAELQALVDGDPDELAARFGGRLQFGTAGLRAAVGAGPLRMNRLVVRQAADGLASYLLAIDPEAATRGVIIGFDARRKSDLFARDTARVMAARGIRAKLLPGPLPTPVLAWALTELNGAAAVMVTASHNPPADNGYKVYLGDGAQIVPPHDAGISEQIDLVDPTAVELSADDDSLIEALGDEVVDAYLSAIAGVRLRPEVPGVPVAYTPMHGVGGEIACAAFESAGFDRPSVVDAQFKPDPTFPTVSFPNPEEPGAMDLVIALAVDRGAAIAIANDPDADRLGAAIPQPDGSWRRLGGDEIGWLLADHILANTAGSDRLVITTLVSSSLLGKMAKRHGVRSKETFTGFKWIGRTILDHPGLRFVFGYEQALGYLVTARPLDKDGISAAVLLTEVAAVAAAEGTTLQAKLDGIAAAYGRHVTGDLSVRMDPADGAKAVERLQASPPKEIAGAKVTDCVSYPEADLLRFELDGGVRVQVRPSGTEPKVKFYGEAVDADPTPYIAALAALVTA